MMKYFKILLLAFLPVLFIASCDSQDEAEELVEMVVDLPDDDSDDSVSLNSYYSLSIDDNWQYDIIVDSQEATRDSLFVVDIMLINGAEDPFANLDASEMSTGIMSNFIAEGALSEVNAVLSYTGGITIPFDANNEITLEIPITRLYDESVASGEQIDQITQTVTQEIEGVPVTIDAVITTSSLGLQENVTINGQAFPKVIKSSLTVNATITASILGASVTVLASQDVISATNTYAENIGMVNSDLDFQYQLEDLSPFGITLPFPDNAQSTTVQTIVSYDVAGDD